MNSFNSSIIACEQCGLRVAGARHASYLQNFSRHDALHVFVNLDVSFAKIGNINYKYSLIKQSTYSDDFTIRVHLLLIVTIYATVSYVCKNAQFSPSLTLLSLRCIQYALPYKCTINYPCMYITLLCMYTFIFINKVTHVFYQTN